MIISVSFYELLVPPSGESLERAGISMPQRIGIGMALSVVAMMTAARKRLTVAGPRRPPRHLHERVLARSAVYDIGLSDGFTIVGLQEYFYDQMPDNMRSFSTPSSVLRAASSVGSVLSLLAVFSGVNLCMVCGYGEEIFIKDVDNRVGVADSPVRGDGEAMAEP
ncbi:hypothetical protein HPP92_018632 [Vanilla planifolia]|nr:hypothetical protein HPP92_018632 [Vanilla planifolia]